MNNVLLHCCCAPCSLSCIDPLRNEGIEPVAFWYNPNIHPWKEYEARRNCLIDYASKINMRVLVEEDYGLREFVKNVVGDIDNRCTYCYETRLRKTIRCKVRLLTPSILAASSLVNIGFNLLPVNFS